MAHLVLTRAFSWWRLSREIVVACALAPQRLLRRSSVLSPRLPPCFPRLSSSLFSSPLVPPRRKRLFVCYARYSGRVNATASFCTAHPPAKNGEVRVRMTGLLFFFARLGLFLAGASWFFFFNGFCNTENGSKQTPSVSLFFFYLFIPPFSRPETSQQVTLVPLLPFFFHGIARPLLILREFFLSQEIAQSLEERSENRIFQLWPLFGFLMGPNISNRRSCVYTCICVRV